MGRSSLCTFGLSVGLLVLAASCRDQVTPADAPPRDAGALDGPPAIGRVRLGAPDRLLLIGTIVTPDQVIEGEVLVEGSTISCVAAADGCESESGAQGATVIDTQGVIAPGLIDTHNHILFDIFDGDDWSPSKLYQNHNQWTAEPRYIAMLDVKQCLADDSQGKPAWCANTPYGTAQGSLRCEMDKYGELKALVAGTTSVVGLPGTSSSCFGSLARSIDVTQNGLDADRVQTSAIFPPSKADGDGTCANFADGSTTAYLIHCGEGIDGTSLAEYQKLGSLTTTPDCLLAPETAITHGVAFGANEFASMAAHQMKLIWSPASNVFLYGQTADIPSALSAGVTVALAPDWSMGGGPTLLDEMRFADSWDDAHFKNRLAQKDLLTMTTANAAVALSLGDRLGRVAKGYLADLAVFGGDRSAPYPAILGAAPKDVILTMVGGQVLYGDEAVRAAAPAVPGCESVEICGVQKFLCVATIDSSHKLNQTFAEIAAALQQALIDADAQTPQDGFSFAPLTPLAKCP